jgi:NADP-dependent 3-hydroxy acid dehydrogenase YdfG
VTATALACNGCKVYISGRRLEPLQDAEKGFKAKFGSQEGVGSIKAIQGDVSNKEGILSGWRQFSEDR